MSTVAVFVVRFVGRSQVFHLQHVAAFGAALDGAVAGHLLWDKVVSGCVCRGRYMTKRVAWAGDVGIIPSARW